MMTESIWLGLFPSPRSMRVVATRAGETILKAQLCPDPSSGRAVTGLFEALALWEGVVVRAALVVDESSTSSCRTKHYQELFEVLGDSTLLYRLEWVPRAPRRDRSDDPKGLGEFGDLEHFLARSVAR
jgi:hypothetical protein